MSAATDSVGRRDVTVKVPPVVWPSAPVPKPVFRDTEVVNPGGGPHLVCSLPTHFLPEIRAELARSFHVSYCYNVGREHAETILPTAEGLFVNAVAPYRLDRELLAMAPLLRVIVSPSTGSDHVDHEYCRERGIQFRGLKGESETIENIHASAEGSFALMMAMLKSLPRACEFAKAGYWRQVEDELRGRDLNARLLGLVGYGRIGRKMSRYANAFGARVLAYDPYVKIADPWVTQLSSFEELLATADIVSVHVHLDGTTSGLFGRERFAQMKPGAYFVNTARGEIVDEQALIEALESGHLQAAAVDVVKGENTEEVYGNSLVEYARTHERLVVTPHIAGLSVDAQLEAARWGVRELKQYFGVAP